MGVEAGLGVKLRGCSSQTTQGCTTHVPHGERRKGGGEALGAGGGGT